MRRLAILAGVAAALLAPAAANADKPAPSTHANASRLCRAERGTTDATRAAFTAKYGTGKHKSNAFGRCVSATAKAKHS